MTSKRGIYIIQADYLQNTRQRPSALQSNSAVAATGNNGYDNGDISTYPASSNGSKQIVFQAIVAKQQQPTSDTTCLLCVSCHAMIPRS